MVGIAVVERETGLSKDTLRVWERRYGFPTPARDAHGERIYPQEQVNALLRIRRLLDQGQRPGRIFAAGLQALDAAGPGPAPARTDAQQRVLELLKSHRIGELRRDLEQAAVRHGLYRFVTETAAPLAATVGEAWASGELRVFEEHLFSEQLQAVLRGAIAQLSAAGTRPRVLLSTLPGEQHALGLLMAQAVFALEGAECLSLGTQTPAPDLVDAARADDADIVALSFTGSYSATQLADAVQRLRGMLPPATALWCGGAGARRLRQAPAGVRVLLALEEIAAAVADWRAARASA
jgi:DNA-binding transcriptional MerR regulator/methylmalonyl-CoA mutase cobalamin-binding subunit